MIVEQFLTAAELAAARAELAEILPGRIEFCDDPANGPYWTDETPDGVTARYPGMDMAPYLVAAQEQPADSSKRGRGSGE